MRRITICIAAVLALVATSVAAEIRTRVVSGPEGSKAILIQGAANEMDGVGFEYAFLAKAYPGWEKQNQALMSTGGRYYDVLTIRKAGATKKIYFDISEFFGKM